MKKLLGIVVLGLLWCNISYCSEWLTYNSKNNSMESYNIITAKEFGPLQFRLFKASGDSREKVEYEKTVMKELFNYCDKKDGFYPTPKKLFIYGDPEFKDFGIEVKWNGNFIQYQVPYKRYLYAHQYNRQEFQGDIFATCYLDKHGFLVKIKEPGVKPIGAMSRKDVMSYHFEMIGGLKYEIQYFDCNRVMQGHLIEEMIIDSRRKLQERFEQTVETEKIKWMSWPELSNGEFRLKEICSKLINKS